MTNKIGTLVYIDGDQLNEAIGYDHFDADSVVSGLKLTQDSLLVLGKDAAEVFNLPLKVDKLKKFDATFYDPSEVGFVIGAPSDYQGSQSNLDDNDDDSNECDDNWGSF